MNRLDAHLHDRPMPDILSVFKKFINQPIYQLIHPTFNFVLFYIFIHLLFSAKALL